jgi:hypothetical protein
VQCAIRLLSTAERVTVWRTELAGMRAYDRSGSDRGAQASAGGGLRPCGGAGLLVADGAL